MARRWSEEEELALAEIRLRLKDLLDQQPPFPEVVGDRRILRFLRGKQMNIDDATDLYRDFLLWRKKNNVDQIRQEILYGGRNSPFFFPKGKVIIDRAPQIIVTPHSRDREGRPLCLEQYCFNPKEVMKVVSIDDYLLFLTYALEYRAMVMEQMSHELEQLYITQFPNEKDRADNYGVVLLDYTIRDLKGVGFNHLGSDGRAILKAALDLGLPNYPEYLGKSHMINVPTLFSTMWYFLKQILDEPTQAKFEFSGYDYLTALQKDISLENIPACLGGEFELYNEPYDFDVSPTGPFAYPAAEMDRHAFLKEHPFMVFDFETGALKSVKRWEELQQQSVQKSNDSNNPDPPSIDPNPANDSPDPVAAPKEKNKNKNTTAKESMKKSTQSSVSSSSVETDKKGKLRGIREFLGFWSRFSVDCWANRRMMFVAGIVGMLWLLLFEPVALLSLFLVATGMYMAYFQ